MENGFEILEINGIFIISVMMLCFGYFILNRIIKDFFGPRYFQRPEYLRHGYLLSFFISVLWFLWIPVLQLRAKLDGSAYTDYGPWYGDTGVLVFIGVVIFIGGVILSCLYYRR